MSMGDEQQFGLLSTLVVSMNLLIHRESSIQLHVDRLSKQRIEFSKNRHFSFFDCKSCMKHMRNMADTLPVCAC